MARTRRDYADEWLGDHITVKTRWFRRRRPHRLTCSVDGKNSGWVSWSYGYHWLNAHRECAEKRASDIRYHEIVALIEETKKSGTHYLLPTSPGWSVRCRWCGGYVGGNSPRLTPEYALESFHESEHHGPAVEGQYRCEQDNPWHPDPERQTKGY